MHWQDVDRFWPSITHFRIVIVKILVLKQIFKELPCSTAMVAMGATLAFSVISKSSFSNCISPIHDLANPRTKDEGLCHLCSRHVQQGNLKQVESFNLHPPHMGSASMGAPEGGLYALLDIYAKQLQDGCGSKPLTRLTSKSHDLRTH